MSMEDVEFLVRRIIELSDINVLTKRMVRRDYLKLKGQNSLSKAEKHAVNSAVHSIIAELVQKGQLAPNITNKKLDEDCQETEPVVPTENSPSHDKENRSSVQVSESPAPSKQAIGKVCQPRENVIENVTPVGPIDTDRRQHSPVAIDSKIKNICQPTQDVTENETDVSQAGDRKQPHYPVAFDGKSKVKKSMESKKQESSSRSFVLNHSTVTSITPKKKEEAKSKKSKPKQKIFSESQALAAVMDSDFSVQSLDTSESEFGETPSKKKQMNYKRENSTESAEITPHSGASLQNESTKSTAKRSKQNSKDASSKVENGASLQKTSKSKARRVKKTMKLTDDSDSDNEKEKLTTQKQEVIYKKYKNPRSTPIEQESQKKLSMAVACENREMLSGKKMCLLIVKQNQRQDVEDRKENTTSCSTEEGNQKEPSVTPDSESGETPVGKRRCLLIVRRNDKQPSKRRRLLLSDSETDQSPQKVSDLDHKSDDQESEENDRTLVADEETTNYLPNGLNNSESDVSSISSQESDLHANFRRKNSSSSIDLAPSKKPKHKNKNKKWPKRIQKNCLASSDSEDELPIKSVMSCSPRKCGGMNVDVAIKVVDMDVDSVEEITIMEKDDIIDHLEKQIVEKPWKKKRSSSNNVKSTSVTNKGSQEQNTKKKRQQETIIIDSNSTESDCKDKVIFNNGRKVKVKVDTDSEDDINESIDLNTASDSDSNKRVNSVTKKVSKNQTDSHMPNDDLAHVSISDSSDSKPHPPYHRNTHCTMTEKQQVKISTGAKRKQILQILSSDSESSDISDCEQLSEVGRPEKVSDLACSNNFRISDHTPVDSSTSDIKLDNEGDDVENDQIRQSDDFSSSAARHRKKLKLPLAEISSSSDLSDFTPPSSPLFSEKIRNLSSKKGDVKKDTAETVQIKKGTVKSGQSRSSAKLTELRKICRVVGLILRNKKELAGCDTDAEKVNRIKQLLSEKGMKGKPTLKKAEELNLWKEMNELQVDKTPSKLDLVADERPRRKRRRDVFEIGESPEKGGAVRLNNAKNIFSSLQDIVTVSDSESS